MSKKRGLSEDEKKAKLLELFKETQDVFTLKELEKGAKQKKSLNPMLVKDLVDKLIGDYLVEKEKIGSSCYFWAFESKVYNSKKARIDVLKKEIMAVKNKLSAIEAKFAQLPMDKQYLELWEKEADDLSQLTKKRDELHNRIKVFAGCETYESDLNAAREAVERWTDNVFASKKYIKNINYITNVELFQIYEIPEDFDYFN